MSSVAAVNLCWRLGSANSRNNFLTKVDMIEAQSRETRLLLSSAYSLGEQQHSVTQGEPLICRRVQEYSNRFRLLAAAKRMCKQIHQQKVDKETQSPTSIIESDLIKSPLKETIRWEAHSHVSIGHKVPLLSSPKQENKTDLRRGALVWSER